MLLLKMQISTRLGWDMITLADAQSQIMLDLGSGQWVIKTINNQTPDFIVASHKQNWSGFNKKGKLAIVKFIKRSEFEESDHDGSIWGIASGFPENQHQAGLKRHSHTSFSS